MERLMDSMIRQQKQDELADVKIRYAAVVLKNELTKFIIIAAFYLIIGEFWHFLLASAMLFPVRIYSGGLHMNSNIACFLVSFGFYALDILILPLIPLGNGLILLLLLLAFIGICVCSPLDHSNKPIKTREHHLHCKKRAIIFAVANTVFISTLLILQHHLLALMGLWMMVLQSLQLVLIVILNYFLRKVKVNKDAANNQE